MNMKMLCRPGNNGEKSHSLDSIVIPIYLFFIYFIYMNTKSMSLAFR